MRILFNRSTGSARLNRVTAFAIGREISYGMTTRHPISSKIRVLNQQRLRWFTQSTCVCGTPAGTMGKSQKKPQSKRSTSGKSPAKRKRKQHGKEAGGGPAPSRPKSALIYDQQTDLEERMAAFQSQTLRDDTQDFMSVGNYKNLEMNYTHTRLAASKLICHFRLPVDIRGLEGITPRQYLLHYCTVDRRRRNHYQCIFIQMHLDKHGFISYKDCQQALSKVHGNTVGAAQINTVLDIVGADNNSKFDLHLFSALCALSERMLYHVFVTEEDDHTGRGKRDALEEADFYLLDMKLQGCNISQEMKKLFSVL
ncbi:uncharacterized protein LOC133348555 isoform X3 [Lethenteron reissneri]|uniref:uncharacterized protein LOC133348555 isoform X3 n=1 Tax=Lethenteron reissneri TaxID=7753 RepID=UPI002AB63BBB|nr:uncharacterized protein LOC133348555 isoform X3 [Lethenteron reissneri]